MKRLLIWVIFAALPTSAGAYKFSRSGQHLVLSGTSCSEVNSVLEPLIEWTKIESPNKICEAAPSHQGSKCEVIVDNCVPDHVQRYQGVNPKVYGPNCWNLALVLKGIVPALRYSSPEEISFYMNSPLCHQLGDNEQRHPGDIVAIRSAKDQTREEVHAFIYISENLAYSKNGPTVKAPYGIQSMNSILTLYRVPNKPECEANRIAESADCQRALSVFRCNSVDTYLKDTSSLPQEIKKSFRDISNFEFCVEREVIARRPISPTAKINLIDSANALVKYLEDQKESERPMRSEKELFVLTAIQLRLQAMADQFGNNRDFNYATELSRLSNKIRRSATEIE